MLDIYTTVAIKIFLGKTPFSCKYFNPLSDKKAAIRHQKEKWTEIPTKSDQ